MRGSEPGALLYTLPLGAGVSKRDKQARPPPQTQIRVKAARLHTSALRPPPPPAPYLPLPSPAAVLASSSLRVQGAHEIPVYARRAGCCRTHLPATARCGRERVDPPAHPSPGPYCRRGARRSVAAGLTRTTTCGAAPAPESRHSPSYTSTSSPPTPPPPPPPLPPPLPPMDAPLAVPPRPTPRRLRSCTFCSTSRPA